MYAIIHKYATNKDINVKDYEDLNKEQRKKAYDKFVIKHRKSIETDCMGYFWFDKNGNAYQILAKDNYVKVEDLK